MRLRVYVDESERGGVASVERVEVYSAYVGMAENNGIELPGLPTSPRVPPDFKARWQWKCRDRGWPLGCWKQSRMARQERGVGGWLSM